MAIKMNLQAGALKPLCEKTRRNINWRRWSVGLLATARPVGCGNASRNYKTGHEAQFVYQFSRRRRSLQQWLSQSDRNGRRGGDVTSRQRGDQLSGGISILPIASHGIIIFSVNGRQTSKSARRTHGIRGCRQARPGSIGK